MRQQGSIKREDMLELTRRMTLSRNCFSRIAGAYFDEEGYVDGSFNRHFKRLTEAEQKENLEIAKTIPFSETNVQLKEYVFDEAEQKPGGVWQMLMALRNCELKNDALLETLYEITGERYQLGSSYAFYLFYGSYDVPRKGTDKESQWESEEVYSFLVGAYCRVSGDYEPQKPESGFLFPAFRNRCGDSGRIEIYGDGGALPALLGCKL
ncbi:MAG: DUF4317 domain-containing protein [Lachnospiraceae bacterium]|nr:DUF4317 domain-containing protein [Lachnospiraceae bacterium]